jgi:hypothetical protein
VAATAVVAVAAVVLALALAPSPSSRRCVVVAVVLPSCHPRPPSLAMAAAPVLSSPSSRRGVPLPCMLGAIKRGRDTVPPRSPCFSRGF